MSKFKVGNYVRIKDWSMHGGYYGIITFITNWNLSKIHNFYIRIPLLNKEVLCIEDEIELDTGGVKMAIGYDQIEHDFVASSACSKCGCVSDDVKNGSASWLCAARTMPCCNKTGIAKWDHFNGQWSCSQCGGVVSNDPHYVNAPTSSSASLFSWSDEKKNDDIFKPQVPSGHKCICDIINLMRQGCTCKGI